MPATINLYRQDPEPQSFGPPATPPTVTRCGGCRQQATVIPCPDCRVCRRCGGVLPADRSHTTVRGSIVCLHCLNQAYWRCAACGGWNRQGDPCGSGCNDRHDFDSGCDCDDCCADDDDNDDDDDRLVHGYCYKPMPVFHGSGPLFLGPEIEVEVPCGQRTACAELALSHLGSLGYLKEDSSINDGFEIVTHPMSYEWAMANFPWDLLPALAAAGCDTSDTTGIHVHLSRRGFDSPCHIYRWMKLIYRNHRQVAAVARRRSDQWAAFTDCDRRAVKDYAKGAVSDRYRAINTGNRDTFELRVFASTLDPRQVQAALGLAAATVEYTRQLTAAHILSGQGWAWKTFVAWLDTQPAYQPLRRELEDVACVC